VEVLVKEISIYVALSVETVAAVVIGFGLLEALVGLAPSLAKRKNLGRRREVRMQFGGWLLLGLEFELAADIIRTAISPSWTDIGQLAAIAGIRTFLNFFLESDLEKLSRSGNAPGDTPDRAQA
jgi:uncharacterized membrane protein